jgi:hypothetical protein
MNLRAISLPMLICFLALPTMRSFAQSVGPGQPNATPRGERPAASRPVNANSLEAVVFEVGLLRKSWQTLNLRLGEISEKLPALDSKPGGANDKPSRIAPALELLARAEERAGILRKQLIELIEKETSYKSRLAQMDEEVRPENVERSLSGLGTTRTAELREVRRRSLEIEKRGLESLLNLSAQSHARLEEDVRQADSLVSRIRQRLFPLIDREIEKIRTN